MLAIAKGDAELREQVEEWRDNPFNPHLIARMRTVAYQKNVLIKYIQTLIAWGDQLFRQDTIESHQRGDPAVHPGGVDPGAAPQEHPAEGRQPDQDLLPAAAGGHRRLRQRAEGGGEPAARRLLRRHARRRRPGAAAPGRALLLHPQQRQAADALGHRGGPAVQDPPLHEHRRRGAPAAAVRAADRPGAAGQGRRCRAGHRRGPERHERTAAAVPLHLHDPARAGVCSEVKALGSACWRRWRSATPRRLRCCAPATSASCWTRCG